MKRFSRLLGATAHLNGHPQARQFSSPEPRPQDLLIDLPLAELLQHLADFPPEIESIRAHLVESNPQIDSFRAHLGKFRPQIDSFQAHLAEFRPQIDGFQAHPVEFRPEIASFQAHLGEFRAALGSNIAENEPLFPRPFGGSAPDRFHPSPPRQEVALIS